MYYVQKSLTSGMSIARIYVSSFKPSKIGFWSEAYEYAERKLKCYCFCLSMKEEKEFNGKNKCETLKLYSNNEIEICSEMGHTQNDRMQSTTTGCTKSDGIYGQKKYHRNSRLVKELLRLYGGSCGSGEKMKKWSQATWF